MVIKLHPKYSKRVRTLLRKYRFAGIQRFCDTVACVHWQSGRQAYTDKFVRRLLAIGAVMVAQE